MSEISNGSNGHRDSSMSKSEGANTPVPGLNGISTPAITSTLGSWSLSKKRNESGLGSPAELEDHESDTTTSGIAKRHKSELNIGACAEEPPPPQPLVSLNQETANNAELQPLVSSSQEAANNADSDGLLNIDGSCAVTPEDHGPESGVNSESELFTYTRFSPEESEIIRDEARTLGLVRFLQEYAETRGVSARSLLEVFSAPSELVQTVPEFQLLPLLKHLLVQFYRNRPKLREINTIQDVVRLIQTSRRIMVLTGAGVSVSCGIPDFRSPTGIYTRLNEEFGLDDPQQMFDIEVFRETPELFYSFAKELYPYNFEPAPSHAFVKLLEDEHKLLRNYTQNIDTLEHVQGIKNVLNCHGSFATATCIKCGYKCDGKELEEDIMAKQIAYCPVCKDGPAERRQAGSGKHLPAGQTKGWKEPESPAASAEKHRTFAHDNGFARAFNSDDDDSDSDDDDYGTVKGIMKPDITFFGEKLPDEFDDALLRDREAVDLLLVMGSSLKVAPVSDIMGHLPHKVPQIVINKTPILHLNFDVQLLGNADDIVAYLAHAAGMVLRHRRISGGATSSPEFRAVGPVVNPPGIASENRLGGEPKVYEVPKHWHVFPSAAVSLKDLVVASGDERVRLAYDTSDDEDGESYSGEEDGGKSELSEKGDDDDDEEALANETGGMPPIGPLAHTQNHQQQQ